MAFLEHFWWSGGAAPGIQKPKIYNEVALCGCPLLVFVLLGILNGILNSILNDIFGGFCLIRTVPLARLFYDSTKINQNPNGLFSVNNIFDYLQIFSYALQLFTQFVVDR